MIGISSDEKWLHIESFLFIKFWTMRTKNDHRFPSHRNIPAFALQYPGFSPMNRDILCKWTIVWWNSAQGLILKLVDSTRSDSSTSHEEKEQYFGDERGVNCWKRRIIRATNPPKQFLLIYIIIQARSTLSLTILDLNFAHFRRKRRDFVAFSHHRQRQYQSFRYLACRYRIQICNEQFVSSDTNAFKVNGTFRDGCIGHTPLRS